MLTLVLLIDGLQKGFVHLISKRITIFNFKILQFSEI